MPARAAKKPFSIGTVLGRIQTAVAPFADAAMFALRDAGFGTTFQQLVACIISIRTRDEVSLPASLRLLQQAPDAETISRMEASEIDALIRPATFHEAKAKQIHDMAVRVLEEHGGELPCDYNVMTSFSGVGPKCASLALGVACGQAAISVDIHVHRVTNRWGYVSAKTPEQTREALMETLPKKYWIEINRLLVPFGKHVCTGTLPRCSTCPVLEYCHQVGVTEHR
ncbi:MAG TPA: endonuclease III [Candidatus Elarobacter sp.]|nr:endonuclease III [Candidatus Elarobacter sp.]